MNNRSAGNARRCALMSCCVLAATAGPYAATGSVVDSRVRGQLSGASFLGVRGVVAGSGQRSGGRVAAMTYRGRTSQREPISLTLTKRVVQHLRYRIDDTCPNHKRLFVSAWGFPQLRITHSRFGGRFVAKPPHRATATISGRVSATTISGSLSDRSQNSRTHRICRGRATFSLHRR